MKRALVCVMVLAGAGCDPELPTAQDFPILQTLSPVDIDESGVTFRAEVIQGGTSEVSAYGFVWTPNLNVSAADLSLENGISATAAINPDGKTFELRIGSLISGGLTYYVRAFSTFGNKTVYGNTFRFEMNRSEVSAWTRLLKGSSVSHGGTAQGSSNGSRGAVLFGGSGFYLYDPVANSFSGGAGFWGTGIATARITSASIGSSFYYMRANGSDSWLLRFENGEWIAAGVAPFFVPEQAFTHGHRVDSKLYFLGSANSFMYDPATNQWSEKALLPSGDRLFGALAGVSIGDRAFLISREKIVWEYVPGSNTWTSRTVFPGNLSKSFVTFAYGSKIYFGLGQDQGRPQREWLGREFWSYDLGKNMWELVELFPTSLYPAQVFFFSLNDRLYIGHGGDLWEFDPTRLQ